MWGGGNPSSFSVSQGVPHSGRVEPPLSVRPPLGVALGGTADGWGPGPNEAYVSGEVSPSPHPASGRTTNPRGAGRRGVAGKPGRGLSGDVTAPPQAGYLLPARCALAESSPGETGVRISHLGGQHASVR